jgi:hypothetical protein
MEFKKMNVYERLGFDVYWDGSVQAESRMLALEKQGYISSEEITYRSWCEAEGRSAVSPFSARGFGLKCCLHPINGLLGVCNVEWAWSTNDSYVLDDPYSPSTMVDAFKKVACKIAESIDGFPSSMTRNLNNDPRFTLTDYGWRYLCHPCELKLIRFSNGDAVNIPIDRKTKNVLK